MFTCMCTLHTHSTCMFTSRYPDQFMHEASNEEVRPVWEIKFHMHARSYKRLMEDMLLPYIPI